MTSSKNLLSTKKITNLKDCVQYIREMGCLDMQTFASVNENQSLRHDVHEYVHCDLNLNLMPLSFTNYHLSIFNIILIHVASRILTGSYLTWNTNHKSRHGWYILFYYYFFWRFCTYLFEYILDWSNMWHHGGITQYELQLELPGGAVKYSVLLLNSASKIQQLNQGLVSTMKKYHNPNILRIVINGDILMGGSRMGLLLTSLTTLGKRT